MAERLSLLRPADLSDIRCEYQTPEGDVTVSVLVIAFFGTYRKGSQGNPDGAFVRGQVMAGMTMYMPSCLVLDFRNLSYEWGNTLLGVFEDIHHFTDDGEGPAYPVITVTSDKSGPALHSLLGIEGPSEFHHVDMDAALAEARRQAKIWLES
jgi:hypothetical protein